MAPEPIVSVIIPLYNKRPYVERCLRSVRAQTVTDYELVVVDDGSTDGSAELVVPFLTERDRLITQENRGVSAARNRGIEAARSGFVALLDADDEWLPNHLANLLLLRSLFPEAGLYATGFRRVMADGLCIESTLDSQQPQVVDAFRTRRRISVLSSTSVAVPRHIALAEGGFRDGVLLGEDVAFFNRVCMDWPLAYHPEVTAVYHYQAVGSASQRHAGRLSWADVVLGTLQDQLEGGRVPEQRRDSVAEYLAHQRLRNLPLHDREAALRALSYPYMYQRGTRQRAALWRLAVKWLPLSVLRLYARVGRSRWGLHRVIRDSGAIQRVYRIPPPRIEAEPHQ